MSKKQGRSPKYTKESIVEVLRKKFDPRFDFRASDDFKTILSNIIVICNIHGESEVKTDLALTKKTNTNICVGCKIRKPLTMERFLKESHKSHGNKYDYSLVTSVTTNNYKIKIICPIHKEFEQFPLDHMGGHGCIKCGAEITAAVINAKKITLPEFLERANARHNFKYDYSLVTSLANDMVTIICSKHKEFSQRWKSHFNHGCNECGNDTIKLALLSNIEEVKLKCIKVHGDKYDYSKAIYISKSEKIEIICNKHNTSFWQSPNLHLNGQGCPKCMKFISQPETDWLDSLNITIRTYYININGRRFYADGYDPITNTVYEFNGDYYHGNPKVFKPEELNTVTKKTFKELHEKTLNKEKILKEAGYNVISIWESDYYDSLNIESINETS